MTQNLLFWPHELALYTPRTTGLPGLASFWSSFIIAAKSRFRPFGRHISPTLISCSLLALYLDTITWTRLAGSSTVLSRYIFFFVTVGETRWRWL